jgi:hypothetical protein
MYCDLAQSLIGISRRLYAEEPFGIELKDTVYALDPTTIDLCLSVFSWAPTAVKLHTLLALRGSIPSFIFISDGKLHDVNILKHLTSEPGAFYVMDRAYIATLSGWPGSSTQAASSSSAPYRTSRHTAQSFEFLRIRLRHF